MTGGDNKLQDLQAKLSKLEASLKILLQNTEAELELATLIQKKLFKDRLPQIPGMQCYSRYISSFGVSAEGFEIFASEKGRDIWLIGFWTQTFGLSSLLMQTLLHFQSQTSIYARDRDHSGVDEVFNDLSMSLADAKKQAAYRLAVIRIDTHTLTLTGRTAGMMPLFSRNQKGKAWQRVDFEGASEFARRPELIEAANSAAPVTADRAHSFQLSLTPGTRLFYFGSSWTGSQSVPTLAQALNVDNLLPDSTLVEDLNHLFVAAEKDLEKRAVKADLCAVGFEIEAGKLHLA